MYFFEIEQKNQIQAEIENLRLTTNRAMTQCAKTERELEQSVARVKELTKEVEQRKMHTTAT